MHHHENVNIVTHKKMNNKEIKIASDIIKNWWVIAFPTETVYWLWASIYNKEAIKRIFKIKWRAPDNPLIVHIDDINKVSELAINIPDSFYILAKKFWPWPLTMILRKKDNIIDEITAWGDSIAIRIPNNEIALEIIKKSWVPIAAPSANLSWKPSPTSACHVKDDLWNSVDYIVEWWNTNIWIESTVIDLTINNPIILRPWFITIEDLKETLPEIKMYQKIEWSDDKKVNRSPWMKYRHYSPNTPLILIDIEKDNINNIIEENNIKWKKIWFIYTKENKDKYNNNDNLFLLWSRNRIQDISKNLFKILREIDKYWLDIVYCETFLKEWIGIAIMDRLSRASENKIVLNNNKLNN